MKQDKIWDPQKWVLGMDAIYWVLIIGCAIVVGMPVLSLIDALTR